MWPTTNEVLEAAMTSKIDYIKTIVIRGDRTLQLQQIPSLKYGVIIKDPHKKLKQLHLFIYLALISFY